MLSFLKNLGPVELIIIFGIILLFFGATLFKNFGKGIGESAREVKNLKKEINKIKEEKEEEPTP